MKIKKKIYHYWTFQVWNLEKWEKVFSSINKEKRIINAKNHSAWHLLSTAIKNIGLKEVNPEKGFHFPDWCYVECNWTLEGYKEEILKNLNTELQNLISKKLNIEVDNSNSLSRRVIFEGYEWIGCWWTHVKNISEIWKIEVTKIKVKKWRSKFSYKIL